MYEEVMEKCTRAQYSISNINHMPTHMAKSLHFLDAVIFYGYSLYVLFHRTFSVTPFRHELAVSTLQWTLSKRNIK